MRVGTWNLERNRGRTAGLQSRLVASLDLDIAVLTEPGYGLARSEHVIVSPPVRMGSFGPESWIAIETSASQPRAFVPPFERLAVGAIATIDAREIVVYGSVLPWRAVRTHAPELVRPDESAAATFKRVLSEQVEDLEALRVDHPGALVIWAGDFNQSLGGANLVGSRAGRHPLEEALDRLGFDAWNRGSAHARSELMAIDLICGPRDVTVGSVERVNPIVDGSVLSDHAGYVVEFD